MDWSIQQSTSDRRRERKRNLLLPVHPSQPLVSSLETLTSGSFSHHSLPHHRSSSPPSEHSGSLRPISSQTSHLQPPISTLHQQTSRSLTVGTLILLPPRSHHGPISEIRRKGLSGLEIGTYDAREAARALLVRGSDETPPFALLSVGGSVPHRSRGHQ